MSSNNKAVLRAETFNTTVVDLKYLWSPDQQACTSRKQNTKKFATYVTEHN